MWKACTHFKNANRRRDWLNLYVAAWSATFPSSSFDLCENYPVAFEHSSLPNASLSYADPKAQRCEWWLVRKMERKEMTLLPCLYLFYFIFSLLLVYFMCLRLQCAFLLFMYQLFSMSIAESCINILEQRDFKCVTVTSLNLCKWCCTCTQTHTDLCVCALVRACVCVCARVHACAMLNLEGISFNWLIYVCF